MPCDAEPTVGGRLARFGVRFEDRFLPLAGLRVVLIGVLVAHALWSLLRLLLAGVVLAGWHSRWHQLDRMLDVTQGHGWKSLVGLSIAAAAELVVGVGCAAGAVQWLRGNEERGVRLALLRYRVRRATQLRAAHRTAGETTQPSGAIA